MDAAHLTKGAWKFSRSVEPTRVGEELLRHAYELVVPPWWGSVVDGVPKESGRLATEPASARRVKEVDHEMAF